MPKVNNLDAADWKTFVNEFVIFCLKISLGIPKGEKKFMFIPLSIKYDMSDFPDNLCPSKNTI